MQKSFIISLVFAIAILCVACDNSETSIQTSSETRVKVFTFHKDTANLGLTEVEYKIEHLADTGLIYCPDSLRFGTRLDSVVPYVTCMETPASITYFTPDTILVSTASDTLDFTKNPIYLCVKSSDLEHTRWYRINIFVHQADPNLYVWKQLTPNIFPSQNCKLKAFFAYGKLNLFVNNGFTTHLYQSTNGADWTKNTAFVGLPAICDVRDILQLGDTLYYVNANKLYTSVNVQDWVEADFSDRTVDLVNMLVEFDGQAWCILQDKTTSDLFLGVVRDGDIVPAPAISGLNGNVLPKSFPISDYAALKFQSSSERPRAMIVGGRDCYGNPVNTRWNLEYELSDGYRMVDFSINQPSFKSLTGASIVQYDNHLMMFGGIDNDMDWRSDLLYSDDEGMNWYVPDTAQNILPDTYTSRQNQTVVVDDKQNIFVIGGQSFTESYSDVYCGYQNELKWQLAK